MVEPVNSSTVVTVDQLLLQGGDVALDFVNTVGGLRDLPPDPDDEALNSYADVVHWSRRVEVLSARQANSLLRAAEADPRRAARVFDDVLALRQLVYDVFRALADGRRPKPAALESLRDAEREALAHASLRPAGPRMRWSWRDSDIRAPLWLIAHAAVELLTYGPLERLKVCANCRWLFLDQSRNRSRRWCSMADCGSAVKKERFVERRRSRRAGAPRGPG
jgi:predicted RNA-binding Zn ribbon-like protein